MGNRNPLKTNHPTLLDGCIFLAATGFGLALLRFMLQSGFTDLPPAGARISYYIFSGLATIGSCWSVAYLFILLRNQPQHGSSVLLDPSAGACFAVLVYEAVFAVLSYAKLFLQPALAEQLPSADAGLVLMFYWLCMVPVGFVCGLTFACLLLHCKVVAKPPWIKRIGFFLVTVWVICSPVDAYLVLMLYAES